jgi:hypothetical protein
MDILTACSEFLEIQSAWLALSKGKEALRSKVHLYAEERKAQETVDKASHEAGKQRLERIEENLLLKNQF